MSERKSRLYVACNAGLSWTHHANRAAFYRHQIVPRTLVDTNTRDTATSLFNHRITAPVGLAPVGLNRIYHHAGEKAPAKVARELGLPYVLSSAASCSIEDVAAANGDGDGGDGIGGGLRFFQLYMSPDEEMVRSLLKRAHARGFAACIFTTDTWQLGWRHDDVHAANYAFYHEGHGAGSLALADPVFREELRDDDIDPLREPRAAGTRWVDEHIWHGQAHTWDGMVWVMREWARISGGKPFVLKGTQSVADAKKAVELGVDGIIVSNHAGRQVDGAIASLDALEKIVDAVGNQTTVSRPKTLPNSSLSRKKKKRKQSAATIPHHMYRTGR